MSTEEFTTWLERELATRGWRPVDLSNAAGLPPATISNVLNGNREVGAKVATAIATALNIPPEFVFRRVGLLPPEKNPNEYEPIIQTLADILQQASDEDRRDIVEYALWYLRRRSAERGGVS